MRPIIFGLALVWAAVFLFACGEEPSKPPAPSKPAKKETAKPWPAEKKKSDTIRMGVAGAYTGKLAALGIPSKRAAELAVKKANEDGGIFNRRIELFVEDDKCKAEIAAQAASRLIQKEAIIVLGHTCSGATKAALEVYTPANVIVMSPSATNPALTQSGAYPTFFRTISPDDTQAKIQANFVIETLGLTKIALLHDQDDYGKGLVEFVAQFLKKSDKAQIVLHEGITPGAKDYGEVISRIENTGAEIVVYGGYHPEAARLITQMREKGMKIPFISGDGVKDNAFIKSAGQYADGVYATAPQDTSDNPLALQAIQAHKEAYRSEPGTFFLNAYAGTLALLNAVRKSGSLDSNSIRRFLRSSHVETPLGTITFNRYGDVSGYGFSLFQVKNNRYVEIGERE